MNVISLLTPKAQVSFLYDDYTVRQGLEKLRVNCYTAIPVLNRDGIYVGAVSEGDFLWKLLDGDMANPQMLAINALENLHVEDILRPDQYPPVRITVSMEELINSAMKQNFIPVVDDLGSFIGIITRQDIIRFFAQQCEKKHLTE